MNDFEQTKNMIDDWIKAKEENAVIDIILFLKKHYNEKYMSDEQKNEAFKHQLMVLYHGFCEDEDYPVYWSLEKIMNYMKEIENNEETAILHYGINKVKELVDKYC